MELADGTEAAREAARRGREVATSDSKAFLSGAR